MYSKKHFGQYLANRVKLLKSFLKHESIATLYFSNDDLINKFKLFLKQKLMMIWIYKLKIVFNSKF